MYTLEAPTFDKPFIQLLEIAGKIALTNKVLFDELKRAILWYIKYLNQTGDGNEEYYKDCRFFVNKYWDALALHRFKIWLLNEPSLNPGNNKGRRKLANILNAIARLMKYAFVYKHIEQEVITTRIEYSREIETKCNDAYSAENEKTIFDAIEPLYHRSINSIRKVCIDGELKTLNLDDRIIFKSKGDLISYHRDILNNNQVVDYNNLPAKYGSFETSAYKLSGSLHLFYENDLNMHYRLDMDALMPLVVYFIYYTGLNTESMLSLKVDSLKKDPLTKNYYLLYFKNRGKGEAYLSLNLFNRQEQSMIIKLYYQILALTKKMRHLADKKDQDYLCIYQSKPKIIKRVSSSAICFWLFSFVNRNDLKDTDGTKLIFNLKRFRRNLITKKASESAPIEVLKEIASHSDILTTYSYISNNRLRPEFDKAMNNAISNIRKSQSEYLKIMESVTTKTIAFKTPLGRCRDPYSPPEYIKNQDNTACSNWNSCLLCPNILITPDESLPKLIAYHKQIKIALERGIDSMSNHGDHYLKLDYVLDSILKPDVCFSEEDLLKATNDSKKYIDQVFDDFVYQGVIWNN